MDNEPNNEYLLIMPDGDCKGFNDFESAKAYINVYYERLIDKNIDEDEYNDVTDIGSDDTRIKICTRSGVEEGRCELYNMEDVIDKINSDLVFDEEKKEVIEKLCELEIDFNIYNNNLDLLISDVEPIDIMESYGEID